MFGFVKGEGRLCLAGVYRRALMTMGVCVGREECLGEGVMGVGGNIILS